MPLYKYNAINNAGRTIRGEITATNEVDLDRRLADIGLELIDAKEVSGKGLALLGNKINHKELILFCIQLEQLEKAGVPILESLSDMRDTSESARMKNLVSEITEAVKNGSILSAALASHPQIFDEVFVGLIAAGERTGQLHTVFHHLAIHLKWVNDIRSKIKKAIAYPIFLLCLMSGIVSLMMLYVIPKLSSFLLAQNFDLPFYTTALIATSKFFEDYWYLIFGGPVLYIIAVKIICRVSYPAAYFFDNIKLNMPVIGHIVRKIEMARFCRFFGITYKSGIGILDCMDISCNVVKNRIVKECILNARSAVYEGSSLTAALRATNQFPVLVVRMIKVGEDGGNLDETLENVNFFYDKEVNESVDSLLGMIQPALTIIMGGIMLWVSLAVFGPLYSSFSKMKF